MTTPDWRDEEHQHEPECMCDMPDENKPELSAEELEQIDAEEEAEFYEVDEESSGVEDEPEEG